MTDMKPYEKPTTIVVQLEQQSPLLRRSIQTTRQNYGQATVLFWGLASEDLNGE